MVVTILWLFGILLVLSARSWLRQIPPFDLPPKLRIVTEYNMRYPRGYIDRCYIDED